MKLFLLIYIYPYKYTQFLYKSDVKKEPWEFEYHTKHK